MEKPLAGILALSSWLPLHQSFPQVRRMLQPHFNPLPKSAMVKKKNALLAKKLGLQYKTIIKFKVQTF